MNTKQITLIASFKARPGKETELRKVLLGLIPPTRKEEDCINYDLHVDTKDPSKLLFYENWTSEAHLNKHGETPHIQALLARIDELCVEPLKLDYLEKIG